MTMWLSVDPLADKYPSLSPYAYCAWNPVKLVDPDGKELYLIGNDECKEKALAQMNSATKNLQFSIEEDGKVVCSGKAHSLKERMMKRIINSTDVRVNLTVQDNNVIEGNPLPINEAGGAYMGNSLNAEKDYVTTSQVVNVNSLAKYDYLTNKKGNLIWHEILESYYGGKTSLKTGVPSGNALESYDRYEKAHNKAGWFFRGTIQPHQVMKEETSLSSEGVRTITWTPIPNQYRYSLKRKAQKK